MLLHMLYRADNVSLLNFLITQLFLHVLAFSSLRLCLQPECFLHLQVKNVADSVSYAMFWSP